MVHSFRLFGRAMLDRLRGEPGRITIERDDGRREVMDIGNLFAPYRDWPDVERQAIRWAQGPVLDVGVGPGRVALYFQRKGIAVTGIDMAPEAVECARRRGVRDARRMNARRLEFPRGRFGSLVMYGNNFGICGDFAATRRFLRSARTITRRGGRLIASTRIPGSWIGRHAAYVMRNVREGRPPGQIRLRLVYKGTTGSWFPLLLVSPDDTLRQCHATGWEVVKVLMSRQDPTSYAFVAERRR